MDAEYRERTSSQLREKVVYLEEIVTELKARQAPERGGYDLRDEHYIYSL